MSSTREEPKIDCPSELADAAKEYAETVDIDVPLHRVDWDVTTRAKNRAGIFECCLIDGEIANPISITLAWDSYVEHGWVEMKRTIRHELIHFWQAVTHGVVDHGDAFTEKAEELGCSIHCEGVTPRYTLSCGGCGESVGESHNRSKIVKAPDLMYCTVCDCPETQRITAYDRERDASWNTWGEFKSLYKDSGTLKPPYRFVATCNSCGVRVARLTDAEFEVAHPDEAGCGYCESTGLTIYDHQRNASWTSLEDFRENVKRT